MIQAAKTPQPLPRQPAVVSRSSALRARQRSCSNFCLPRGAKGDQCTIDSASLPVGTPCPIELYMPHATADADRSRLATHRGRDRLAKHGLLGVNLLLYVRCSAFRGDPQICAHRLFRNDHEASPQGLSPCRINTKSKHQGAGVAQDGHRANIAAPAPVRKPPTTR